MAGPGGAAGAGGVRVLRVAGSDDDATGGSPHQPGALGQTLRSHRLSAGLTQEALAERAGLSARTVSDLERGVHLTARMSTLDRLAVALGLPQRETQRIMALRHGDASSTGSALPSVLRRRVGDLPFVGREHAMGLAMTAWARVLTGEPRALVCVGEAGIGKSRFLAEATANMVSDDTVVLAARCDEPMRRPYGALADGLRGWANDEPLTDLLEDVGPFLPHLARVLPELHASVGPPPPDTDPNTARSLLHEAIDRALTAIASNRALVLVIDDVHAADPTTLDALRYVLQSHRQRRLMVLTACRDGALTGDHPFARFLEDLFRQRCVARIDLGGLDPGALGLVVRAATGTRPTDPVLQRLRRRTGGNPLFVEEILTSLADQATDLESGTEYLPEGVRGVVQLRVRRLSEAARRALQTAAVMGESFERSLIECIPDDDLVEGLDLAIGRGFVDQVDGLVTFRHGIVRSAILDELTAREAARLHWQIGEALERISLHDPDRYVAEIAHHLQLGARAGDPAKASTYLERTGRQHFEALALDEADAALRAALALVPDDETGDHRRLRLLELLAETHFWRDEPDAMRAAALSAARLAQRIGSAEEFARAAVIAGRWNSSGVVADNVLELLDEAETRLGTQDSGILSQVRSVRAYVLQGGAGGFDAHEIAVDAAGMARRCDDTEALAMALVVRTYTDAGMPAVAEMRRVVAELADVGRRVPRRDHAQQYAVFALRARALCEISAGNREGFEQACAELGALADKMHARFLRGQLLFVDAAVALAEGRFVEAEERSRAAVTMWDARPDATRVQLAQLATAGLERGQYGLVLPQIASFADASQSSAGYAWRAAHASGCAAAGDTDAARRRLDVLARADFADVGRDHERPHALRWLAELVALLDAREHAPALLELLEPYSGGLLVGSAISTIEAAADRAIGQTLSVLRRTGEADRAFARAAALESKAGFTALEARTRLWWARLLRDSAPDPDARSSAMVVRATRRAAELGLSLLPATTQLSA